MGVAARYAKAGSVHIAYVTHGTGGMDLVWVPTWVSQCEHLFAEPSLGAVAERIGLFARMITFDRRGSGLSDPMMGAPTLEEQMDDILAVMDEVGSERAALFGTLEGGPLAMLFAATYPERVSGLILYATFARAVWAPDYDWTWTKEERDAAQEELVAHWGDGFTVHGLAPSRANDRAFHEWAARMERLAASPGTIRRIFSLIGEFDVRHVLPSIRVPTLVMHRRDDQFINFKHAEYIAEHIPQTRLVALEGPDNLFSMGDVDTFVGEIEEFLTGTRHEAEPDRMLATVLFTDICDSTKRAAELGDAEWRKILQQHDSLVQRAIERHRGRAIKSTGDGVLATFDGPARGLRCAASIAEGVRTLGIEVRAGLHTGEVEIMNGDIGGLAVHIGARVMAAAGPSEVLVSSTVRDLVVGSGISFEERGKRELKGVPGEWRLFAVAGP
jgi:class 3 adenylate cyclase